MITNETRIEGSFRDPSGFVFRHEGILYRQVNRSYTEAYDQLLDSGLYAELVKAGLLIPHEEVSHGFAHIADAYKIIRPEPISFISYPYEWSFSQLKDAALALLNIQRRALRRGMVLKDASAYNMQMQRGKPILIDTLSFDRYEAGQPWVAYRQFCQHFLAPLALMAYQDVRLGQLLRVHLDGIPLDLAAKLLPWRTRTALHLLLHIHLHAGSQKRHTQGGPSPGKPAGSFSLQAFQGLIDGLASAVEKLDWRSATTEWTTYYQDLHTYTAAAAEHKQQVVAQYIERVQPATVWDLGANTGLYSRLASDRGIDTIAFDLDPGSVEANYRMVRERRETHLLPLVVDLTNPSPGLGWAHTERMSLLARGPADMVLAQALIHHLAIGNNLPFAQIAQFLSQSCQHLAIEFVPKTDSQVQQLLRSRQDIFVDYTEPAFEVAFSQYFTVVDCVELRESQRRLYLMVKR